MYVSWPTCSRIAVYYFYDINIIFVFHRLSRDVMFICSRIKKAKAEDKKCHAKTMKVQKVESDVSDE